MRWDFQHGVGREEEQERLEIEARVKAWWSAFAQKTSALDDLFNQRADWDLPTWMAETLQKIDGDLMWEFALASNGEGQRLVITSETRRDLRPLVRHILREAPRLNGWEFHGHRFPEPLETARATVEARCGGTGRLSEVVVSRGENHLIDLVFRGVGVKADDDAANDEAFVLTESLLGEELLDCWIGAIEVEPKRKPGFLKRVELEKSDGVAAVPLERLEEAIRETIRAVREGFGDIAQSAESDAWSILKLKPEQSDDHTKQEDLFVATTPSVPLWQASRGKRFYDARFGSKGETFCYLKLDGSQEVDDEKFADRSEIEDALDNLLKPAGWGCQIGGGTGLRYSYVELVVTDPQAAFPAIRKLLQDGNIAKRSWILFHGCEYETEWIGIYDDTPAPP